MKYQQVSVDLVNMLTTACSYLALAGAAWILLRLLQACFWLPRHLKKQNNVQALLQAKVDSYEEYLKECEAKDKLAGIDCNFEGTDEDGIKTNGASGNCEKWRKQRENLELLKRELNRVRDGDNIADWDYLLEENQAGVVNYEKVEESVLKGRETTEAFEACKKKEEEQKETNDSDDDGKKNK